jgi:hypothetical protein
MKTTQNDLEQLSINGVQKHSQSIHEATPLNKSINIVPNELKPTPEEDD